jgi:hypothetical protein
MVYLIAALLLLSGSTWAQGPAADPRDMEGLPRLKDFSAYRSSSNNPYVDSNDDCKHPIPGETVVLADLQGPGIVTHLWVTVADNEYGWPRLARLRVYYDGYKTPSVDVPLGDFFGVGHGYERNLNSLMVRNSSLGRARNSYWPMPFRKSCRITLTNEGQRRITSLYYHVDWQKRDSLPPDIAYFHAYYRQENPPWRGKNYTILDVHGKGHYVGSVLNIIQTQIGWFGEGDDLFYVDGEKTPRIEGTGSEDYFNDAWGLRVSDGAWTGIPVAEGEGVGARLTGYRWHVPDVIPFTKSLRLEIEHAGWTYNPDGTARSGFEERFDDFSSVAFWYQQGVNQDLPEVPYGDARLPFGNAQQIEVEDAVGNVQTEKGEVSVQKEVFWSKDLLFFKSQGVGSSFTVPIGVPKGGRYEVVAQVAAAPDYGDYEITLDGKPTSSTTITWGLLDAVPSAAETYHNYEQEIFVANDHRLGWFDLAPGRHLLKFICVGKDARSGGYNLGVDDVVLAEVGQEGRELSPAPSPGSATPGSAPSPVPTEARPELLYRGQPLSAYMAQFRTATGGARADSLRAIAAFGKDAAPAVNEISPALADAAPEVRTAAARALAEVGDRAGSAAEALGKALSDSDQGVRESVALALREMPGSAVRALPALLVALQDPAPTVRMTVATALGRVQGAAAQTVPALAARLDAGESEVQVMRNIAYALGEIGPAARAAIPSLQRIQHLRVKYIAAEAIAHIEGKPVPTWH